MEPRPLPTRLDTAVPLLFGLTRRPLLALCLGGGGAALLWLATAGLGVVPRAALSAAPLVAALGLALARLDGETPEAAAAAALRFYLRPRARAWAPRGQEPVVWPGERGSRPAPEALPALFDDTEWR